MHLSSFVSIVLVTVSLCASYEFGSTAGTDRLAARGLYKLGEHTAKNPGYCSLKNAVIREEWSALSIEKRKEFIAAVLCLQSKPSIARDFAPGARSRYDDFVAVHINQTNLVRHTIHSTGIFLSWHRYYVWSYEEALRNECGYKGYLPYWNWGKYAHDPINSPLFDGSDSSLSGNGRYRKHPDAPIPSASDRVVTLPSAQGGGCVETGPFKNMTVNLGGQTPLMPYVEKPPRPDGLGHNPRCLRRDISQYTSSRGSTDANSTALIKKSPDIASFQNTLQRLYRDTNEMGLHAAGHFTIAGDPGGDLHSSPGDPAFWLHHAQVDRTWWIWQNQDLNSREQVIAGTITMFNKPPSRKQKLSDGVRMGVNARTRPIKDLVSTMKGPFCYIYA